MDVHGTKLARTLFTIAGGWNGVPTNNSLQVSAGIALFSTSLVRRGLTVVARATCTLTLDFFPASPAIPKTKILAQNRRARVS
jgi:hypothetical protein